MVRLFGYDDATGRNWINLDYVAKARYDKARHTAEITLGAGSEGGKGGERLTLSGDVAAAFAKTLALIEADSAKR
jgi:hypothetical protein